MWKEPIHNKEKQKGNVKIYFLKNATRIQSIQTYFLFTFFRRGTSVVNHGPS